MNSNPRTTVLLPLGLSEVHEVCINDINVSCCVPNAVKSKLTLQVIVSVCMQDSLSITVTLTRTKQSMKFNEKIVPWFFFNSLFIYIFSGYVLADTAYSLNPGIFKIRAMTAWRFWDKIGEPKWTQTYKRRTYETPHRKLQKLRIKSGAVMNWVECAFAMESLTFPFLTKC